MPVEEQSLKYLEVVDDSEFTKPEESNFKCRFEQLKNGLEIFLISSEKLNGTCVNLLVKVGSAHEGSEIDGLAHFLEHSLFLGTKNFPGQNEFGKFVRTHGGATNASTDVLMTHYSFSIPNQFLEPTLERFCEFFKSPLFSEEYLQNEINVVESEFLSKTNNYYTLLEHVFKQIADETHIYSKFFYGNSKTLKNLPEKNGISLRERTIRFFEEYYGSENMVLFILSNFSIQELSRISFKYFSSIRSCTRLSPKPESLSLYPEFPYLGVSRKLVKIHLNTNKNELMLIFPLPKKEYGLSRIFTKYLSFFLCPKTGEGLLNDIIQKKLCYNISLSDTYSQLGFSYIAIILSLSEQGILNMKKVILSLFSAFQIVKKTTLIDEYIQRISNKDYLDFLKIEDILPSIPALELLKVYYMTKSTPQNLFSAYYFTPQFSQQVFEDFMSYLNVEKMVAIIIGSQIELDTLIKQKIIQKSNYKDYLNKKKHFKDYIANIIRSGYIGNVESKYLLTEKHFKTNYSIWDFSERMLSSISEIKVESGVDFSNVPLPMQTIALLDSTNINKMNIILKPPLLLDIAYQFEKLKLSGKKDFPISRNLKISSIWRGLFYIQIPRNTFSSSFFVFRLVIPPLFGKKSFDQFSESGFYIRNMYHSYALTQLFAELIKKKINLSFDKLSKEGTFLQIYPTYRSPYPNYAIGIEYYLYGKLDNLSKFMHELSHTLKNICKIKSEEFEVIKEETIGKLLLMNSQLLYRDLICGAENEVLNTGFINNKKFLNLVNKVKMSEIIALSIFFRKNCIFEGIFAGSTPIHIFKAVLDDFISNLRGLKFSEINKPLFYVKDNPDNDNYFKFYYKKIFFIQNEDSHIYTKKKANYNGFDLIDLFSIPPNKNKIYYLTKNIKSKHNLIRLSVFFKKESPITFFKLQMINQVFFDILFEHVRQRKQIAYEFNSEVCEVSDKMLSYSFIIQTDNHTIMSTTLTLLECLKELSPKIINEELFKVVLLEKIEFLEQGDSVLMGINSFITNTFNRTFNYKLREEILENLRSLSFIQFQSWFSLSLKNAPILITACISENANSSDRKISQKFIPPGFTKIKKPMELFKINKVKSYYIYQRIFN
ncbi:insulinase-like peptidase [Cryptosporidium ubiquitum]|uniref:Insulinase-like peptidase n=1 Tax=Cryptosporidium ubiquitum TaxID=857276 RepID=A0A1J4MLQ5_9CRYT|nr:insulinase-like peptidase [Cryptosporidium ubiquitum]OII74387.1 insulinase-like peptidase [Cryptosporidium ubiquitum]